MATSEANYYSTATPPQFEGATGDQTATPPAEADTTAAEGSTTLAEGAISTVSLDNIQIQDPSKDISFR